MDCIPVMAALIMFATQPASQDMGAIQMIEQLKSAFTCYSD